MLLNPLIDIDMFKLSSFCKLILCSSCTLVCLKIVVWVKHAPLCNMNPAVYLKWVLTNHPHVSSWSETSLSVAVAGTIPFFHISVMPAASDGSIWHPGRRNSLSLSFSFFPWWVPSFDLCHFSKLAVVWLQSVVECWKSRQVVYWAQMIDKKENSRCSSVWLLTQYFMFLLKAKTAKHLFRFIS